MKLNNWCIILLFAIFIFSCRQNNSTTNSAPPKLLIAPTIIQMCIDSVSVLDSSINTESYYVDVEYLRKAYPNLVAEYLNDHPEAKVTNFDSLVKTKSLWLNNDFKKNDVIQFKSVQEHGDTIVIETTKKRFIDANFGAEILFKKKGGRLICIKSAITWIN